MTPDAGSVRLRPFTQSLPMALLRAREAVMRRFRPALRTQGVTEQQWRILRALAHAKSLEVTALAQATFLLPPSLSRILPDLESRGLIHRRPVDSDQRRAVIALASRGRKLIASHAPASESTYDGIARAFGQARLEQLFTLLRELEACLESERAETKRRTSTRRRSRA